MSLYDDGKPPKRIYLEPQVMFSSISSLKSKNVLVVDDFIHTGDTLKKVIDKVYLAGAKEVRSAVVGFRINALYSPEYVGTTFKDCLRFPWDIAQEETTS